MHELTQDQIDEFQDRGYLRVPQQVPEEMCVALRDQIWHRWRSEGLHEINQERGSRRMGIILD